MSSHHMLIARLSATKRLSPSSLSRHTGLTYVGLSPLSSSHPRCVSCYPLRLRRHFSEVADQIRRPLRPSRPSGVIKRPQMPEDRLGLDVVISLQETASRMETGSKLGSRRFWYCSEVRLSLAIRRMGFGIVQIIETRVKRPIYLFARLLTVESSSSSLSSPCLIVYQEVTIAWLASPAFWTG